MGLYQYTIFWIVICLGILLIVLPSALIRPGANTGSASPRKFYTPQPNVPWIVPVTPQCVPSPPPVTPTSEIRETSNSLFFDKNVPNDKYLSNLIWGFAQLVMEDLFRFTGNTGEPTIDILLSEELGYMNVTQIQTQCNPGMVNNPWGCCEAPNAVTSILDCSWLYGDNTMTANALRSGERGRMSLSVGGNLPLDPMGNFKAGTPNVNENPLLASLVTLFVLEHNEWASTLFSLHPDWTDDQLFYKARSYVILEYQAIIFNEFVPALLPVLPQQDSLPIFPGVSESSQVTMEMALTAGPFFRSMLNGVVTPLTNNTSSTVTSLGIKAILENAWLTGTQMMDIHVAETLCNNSLTKIDYVSRLLAWGQQVGLASYGDIATAYGLPISSPYTVRPLSGVFGEYHRAGSSVGESVYTMLSDQLMRSARYDPYFYTNIGMESYIGSTFYFPLLKTRIADVIQRNIQLGPGASSGFYVRQ